MANNASRVFCEALFFYAKEGNYATLVIMGGGRRKQDFVGSIRIIINISAYPLDYIGKEYDPEIFH